MCVKVVLCCSAVSCTASSTASRPKSVVNLMTGLSATEDVSLNGSPTVSPMTVASWSGVPFCLSSTSTIFLALSQAPPALAKKIVEVELKQKGTPLHDATVIGDTVGDPFKDTSSVALNPIIKFTTLFGLLAVELAVKLTAQTGGMLTHVLSAAFFAVSFVFVYRSFYGMRIRQTQN